MSPTPAEAVAATLTPLTTNSKKSNNNKHGADVDTAAAAAAAARLSFAKSVSDANEYTKDLPPPPEVGISTIGSDILLMTPKQMAEAYEKAMQAKENAESEENEESKEKKSAAKQGIKFSFNWRSILRILSEFPDKLLQAVGRFLRFILHLDMHGGNTGNNTKFVEGLIDFLAGSIGE